MGTAEEYRHVAWDCLKLADASSNPQTHASLLNLSQYWVRLAEEAERSRAQSINDPERRADMLRFAGMWMSLTEPIQHELRGAYELPPQRAA